MQSFVLRPTQFSDYSGSESESEVDSAPQPGTPALSAYTSAYISAMSSAEAAGDAALLASHSATVSTPAVYKAPQLSRTTPCGWIPNHTMTEKILRARFAVPPEQAIDLSILPDTDDPSVKRWPDVHDILQITIFGAPGHKLASGGIFKALKARFRYYRELSSTEDMVWKVRLRDSFWCVEA